MCVKELVLIFCQLFSSLNLLFVIWYLGVYRSAIIQVRCLPVQMRVDPLTWRNWTHVGFCLVFHVLPYLWFSKLILQCRIVFPILTVIFAHMWSKAFGTWNSYPCLYYYVDLFVLFVLFRPHPCAPSPVEIRPDCYCVGYCFYLLQCLPQRDQKADC